MTSYLNIPAVHFFLLPFLGTVLITGLIRFIGRESSGLNLANASVGAGFTWVGAFILGTPLFPPAFNSSAILSATVCLLAIGIIFDLWISNTTKVGRLLETSIIILGGIAIAAWMRGGIDFWTAPILLGWGAALFSLQRISANREFGAGSGALMLALGSLGLFLIAWISDIADEQNLSLGLSAAAFGFAVWNWPKPRLFFGRSILLAGGGSLCMIALRLIEQAPPLIPAVVIVGFILFADRAVGHIPQSFKLANRLPASLKFITLAIIPLVLAALATLIATEFPIN